MQPELRQRERGDVRTVVALAVMAPLVLVILMGGQTSVAEMAGAGALIVGPTLYWLGAATLGRDRYAGLLFAWGVGVAFILALAIEGPLGTLMSTNTMAVIGAPLVEEGVKLLGLLWIIRVTTREGAVRLDSVGEVMVFAGWVALGFAAIEDAGYLMSASQSSSTLTATWFLRDLITPFGHPLFTSISGVAVAVSRRSGRRAHLIWGWLGAATLHGTFNGVAAAVSLGHGTLAWVLGGVEVVAFFAVYGYLAVRRMRERGGWARAVQTGAQLTGQSADPAVPSTFAVAKVQHAQLRGDLAGQRAYDAWVNRLYLLGAVPYAAPVRAAVANEAVNAYGALRSGIGAGPVTTAPAAPQFMAPGWYPIDGNPLNLRWWDGTRWGPARVWDGARWVETR